MHTFRIFLALLLLAGVGCVSPQQDGNDFEPIRGKASGSEQRDAPLTQRIMTARSSDGLTYVQNGSWVCDQCHAPDAVIKNGTIYLYYTGWILGERINTSAVAISKDNGTSWTYKYLELEGGGTIDRVVDPDVVLLEDGTFRLFFTAGNPQGIHYAESPDGISFTYKGVTFAQTDDIAEEPTAWKIADTWQMYAQSRTGAGRLWHLTGSNGLDFSVYDLTSFPIRGDAWTPANGIWLGDRMYLFLSHKEQPNLESMWSKNGFDWYPSGLTHIAPDGDEEYVRDPAVVELDDGRYLMFYVTQIP